MTLKNTLQFIVRLIAENIPVPSGFAPMKSGGATATFHAAVLAVALLLSCAAGAESIQSLRAKAEQGDADAQYSLGVKYRIGRGVPESDVEAVKWFRRAAEQGHISAQWSMGHMYDEGYGVQENNVTAANWFLRAAKQGDADAQFSLSLLLYGKHNNVSYTANGFSTMQEAYIWASLSSTGNPDGSAKKDAAKKRRDKSAAKLSRSELEAAQAEAVRRHAEIEEMLEERRKAKEKAESGN